MTEFDEAGRIVVTIDDLREAIRRRNDCNGWSDGYNGAFEIAMSMLTVSDADRVKLIELGRKHDDRDPDEIARDLAEESKNRDEWGGGDSAYGPGEVDLFRIGVVSGIRRS